MLRCIIDGFSAPHKSHHRTTEGDVQVPTASGLGVHLKEEIMAGYGSHRWLDSQAGCPKARVHRLLQHPLIQDFTHPAG
jgi:hypothetical protein